MLGSSQVINSLVGIVKNKTLAVILGPTGVGLFAQLQTVQIFASSVIPLGMQVGVVKYIAEYRAKNPEKLPGFVSISSRAFLGISFISALFCIVFLKQISALTLDDSQLFIYLLPPLLGVPFIIQSQFWQSYLQARLELKAYSKAIVMPSVIGIIVAIPMVILWKQNGAAVSLLLIPIAGYACARVYSNRTTDIQLKEDIRKSEFKFDIVKNLLRISIANFPVFLLTLGMPFLIRTQIINDLGFTANGIYQALFAISGQYLNVPLNAVGTYILPKLIQLNDPKEINPEINRAVKLVLLLITFGILVILLIRDIAINILFSSKFLPAVALFSWQMVGDLFKSVTMTIQVPLLIQERFRARNIQHILQYGLFLLVFYLAPASNRLQGAVLAHAISWAFALIITYKYLNWLNDYRFDKANRRLMITSTIAVVVVAFLPLNLKSRLLGCGITIVWAISALTPSDWNQLFTKVRNRLRNRTD